jgi:regulator of RNase E activity RraA
MDNLLARLTRLDACAVSDALDKLGLTGAVTGIHRLATNRRISGRVVTVKLEKDDGRPVASRHLGTTAIESCAPRDVIVIEQRSGIDAAAWGGNLSLGAQLRGVSGVIIDGPARDVDESRDYGFPLFARDHTSRTARGRIVETGTNVPITVGDITVTPGDYVVADGSAVVFVPAADVARVLDAAEAIAAKERAMVTALREGQPISQVMGKNYETMLKS